MNFRTLLSAALLAALPLSVYAQGLTEPGYELKGSLPNPAPFSAYTTLQDGTRAHFDGNTVSQHSADGTFIQNLHVFPTFNFTGCIAADPSGDSLLVGESTNGEIYRVDMDGSGATLLATLPFNYSAVYAAPGVAYVSAAVDGFGAGNDIIRIDTLTGDTSTVAQVDGPSGPITMDAQGDLIYGTSTDVFPAPTGSSKLYKYTSGQLNSGVILGDADAEVLNSALDPISSIAVDPVIGDFVISTNVFDASFTVVKDEILIVRPNGNVKDVVSMTSGAYRSTVELTQGSGPGHFRAYQPEGVELTWLEGGEIHTLAPKRPTSAVVSNGGNSYSFVVSGAEPGGAMLLAFGNSALHQGVETSYQLNFDFLYHSGLTPGQTRRVGQFLIPCDSNGTASFPFWDAGNLQGTVVFQGVITDQSGAFIGASESAFH